MAQSQDVKREIYYADKDYITMDLSGEKDFTFNIESKNGGSVDWVGYVIELDAKEFSSLSDLQKKAKDKRTTYIDEKVSADKIIYAQAKSYFRYIDVISAAIDYAAEKVFGSAIEDTAALSDDSGKIYLIRAYSGSLGKSDDPQEKAFVRKSLTQGKERDTQAAALNIFAVALDTFGLFVPYDSTFKQDDLKRIAAIGLSEATHAFGEVDVMSGRGDAKDIFEIIVRSSKSMLKEFVEIAEKEATKNFLRLISKNAEMAIKAINITNKISKGGKIVDRVYQMEWQATPLETSYVITPKALTLLAEKKSVENKEPESSPMPWKTVSKEFFTIQIPQVWKETISKKSGYYASIFRFEGADGEFFEVGIDPIPLGLPGSDELWRLQANASDDGFIIEKEDTIESEMFNTHGDGKLEINAFAKKGNDNIFIQNHVYYFFFGNDKHEDNVDTSIFRKIISSFRTLKTQPPRQSSSGLPVLSKEQAASLILKDLKMDRLQLKITSLQYDNQNNGYYDIFGKLTNSYVDLENLGFVTVIIRGDLFTSAKVQFTLKAEPYLVKDAAGTIKSIIEAVPEKVEVNEISTRGFGIGYSCSDDCYIANYTVGYKFTPFGQSFNKNAAEVKFVSNARVAPMGDCWEVNTSVILTSMAQKVCLSN